MICVKYNFSYLSSLCFIRRYLISLSHRYSLYFFVIGQWLDSISYLEKSITAAEERFGSDSIELANELNKITDICIQYLREETNTNSKQYK